MSSRYFAELSYHGKNYHGWQIQPKSPTVQAVLNQKLSLLLHENIETIGAGRTDTGVHAKYFVAHFNCDKKNAFFTEKLLYKLNCILPADIRVMRILPVPEDSHARFDAVARTYKYYIARRKDVFRQEFVWHVFCKLNSGLMNKCAKILMEYDDFSSFSRLHTQVKTNHCKIMEAGWTEENDLLIFRIKADWFLRNMVRSIVGTMVDVGKEKTSVEEFRKIIEMKDRGKAGMSAPAQGLFLSEIIYPYSF